MEISEVYNYRFPDNYKDKKFWLRPPKNETGASDPKIIYMGVGHALSNWEHVEMSMAMLFGVFVDSHSTAASRAYGSIFGSRGRADALQEAGRTFFAIRRMSVNQKEREVVEQIDRFASYFEKFLENYRSASARRNDIAHGMAYDFAEAVEGVERSWLLIPPMYQASHQGATWTADDIKLRARKGLKMGNPEARRFFLRMVHKNSTYVYDVNTIKTFAGKFAYLYTDVQLFVKIFRINQISSADDLNRVAQAMSA